MFRLFLRGEDLEAVGLGLCGAEVLGGKEWKVDPTIVLVHLFLKCYHTFFLILKMKYGK